MQPAELSSAPVEKYRHAVHALAVFCDLHHFVARSRPLSICTYAVTVDRSERLAFIVRTVRAPHPDQTRSIVVVVASYRVFC